MTTKDKTLLHPSLVVSIPIQHYNVVISRPLIIPKLPLLTPIQVLDFDLPDTLFGQIKLQKLEQVKAVGRATLGCEEMSVVWSNSKEELILKSDFCLHNKVRLYLNTVTTITLLCLIGCSCLKRKQNS